MFETLYNFFNILRVICKNSKKRYKYRCYNCKYTLDSIETIIYFAHDKAFCSEECREIYIV